MSIAGSSEPPVGSSISIRLSMEARADGTV
jgi:hypothetical protein